MFNKKNYLLNCDVCDTRTMKEDDYAGYEKMMINTDVVIVSESSKSILNRLPVTINQDSTIEIADGIDVEVKNINGSYEITANTAVQEHTLLIVNGSLQIHPGTEEALTKYEKIHVNGSVRCPKSLEGYLNKLSANGSVLMYPDDCVILDTTFVMDKYFPLRAKAGSKYYVENMVVIQDHGIDLAKLVQKNVQFITNRLLIPEELIEESVALFDEKVEFIVVPAEMTLVYGDAVLNERLVEKEGSKIYVYGSLKVDENCNLENIAKDLEKLIVHEDVTLKKSQEDGFRKLNAEYASLNFCWEGRIIENKPSAKVDKSLLENSPNKVLVRNMATVKIAADVSPELILDRLVIKNCANVSCSEEQESAIAAIAKNVAAIGEKGEEKISEAVGTFKDLLSTKMINADNYIM